MGRIRRGAIMGRWSPDSLKVALTKVDWREVSKIPVVHWLNPVVEVDWEHYRPVGLRAGGPTYQTEIFIVDILAERKYAWTPARSQTNAFTSSGGSPMVLSCFSSA